MANTTEQMFCLKDFERAAKQLLPKPTFDMYYGGADDQQTLLDNMTAFRRYRLLPRLMRDVSKRDMSVTILGRRLPFPIAVGPSSCHKLAHPDGEIATAKGTTMASAAMCFAGTYSNTKLEEVSEAVKGSPTPLWIQIYVLKRRDITARLIKRAEKAGYTALFVTVDVPVIGKRRSDIRNQFSLPPTLSWPNIDEDTDDSRLHKKGVDSFPSSVNDVIDSSFTWEDLKWLRSVTTLPIVLKGILTAEDAKEAVKYGVSGIVVSNHGGRQLDGVLATIDALPEVAAAVRGSDVEVYLDGGVRTGTDVLKALALGAKAVFIARPVLWGLACDGKEGVKKVIEILREEFDLAMALSGCTSVDDITKDLIQRQSQYVAHL